MDSVRAFTDEEGSCEIGRSATLPDDEDENIDVVAEQPRNIGPIGIEAINSTYGMEPINFYRDTKSNGYELLSGADATKEVWFRVPALIACNRERYSPSLRRTVDLVRFLGKLVIRWTSQYDRRFHVSWHHSFVRPLYYRISERPTFLPPRFFFSQREPLLSEIGSCLGVYDTVYRGQRPF